MRIHENEMIEMQAIETLRFLMYGGSEDDINNMIEVYEGLEAYEQCQGLLLGLGYFKTKNFNCKIGDIKPADVDTNDETPNF